MSQKTAQKISKAEVRRSLEDGIKANDGVRVAGLEGLLRFRDKKIGLQQREQQRLNRKYGDHGSRVKEGKTRLDANVNYSVGLQMEVTRATTSIKKQDETAWAVQGHVYDKQGCAIANADVALYSTDEKKIGRVKATKTNEKGYYQLSFAGKDRLKQGTQILSEADEATLSRVVTTSGENLAGLAAATPDTEDTQTETAESTRLGSGLRINTHTDARALVFVRASDPKDKNICADSTLITPHAGVCSYRDLALDTNVFKTVETKDRRSTHYLGNSSTRELHDLKNEKKRCQIDAIRFDHCINFNTQKKAIAASYDFCAFCFGRKQSKR